MGVWSCVSNELDHLDHTSGYKDKSTHEWIENGRGWSLYPVLCALYGSFLRTIRLKPSSWSLVMSGQSLRHGRIWMSQSWASVLVLIPTKQLQGNSHEQVPLSSSCTCVFLFNNFSMELWFIKHALFVQRNCYQAIRFSRFARSI